MGGIISLLASSLAAQSYGQGWCGEARSPEAAKASGPEMRSSASAEPHLSGRVKERRGPGLDRLPDQAELSPDEAVGLRSSPQGVCQVHTDLGFSQSLTGSATSWPSLLLRGASHPFLSSACVACS